MTRNIMTGEGIKPVEAVTEKVRAKIARCGVANEEAKA